MATVFVKWRCDGCGELHEDEECARECCTPEVVEVYQCSVCHLRFEDEWEADEHCNTHNDDEPDEPTKAELEAHGQQRLPL